MRYDLRRGGCGFVGIVGALLVAAPAARAQQETIDTPYRWIERSFRVTPYIGHVFANRGNLQLGPGSATDFGLRLRPRVSGPLSLELNVGHGSADNFVVDPRLPAGPAVVDTTALDWILLQGGLQLSLTGPRAWHGLQPYIVIAGGAMFSVHQGRNSVFPGSLNPLRFSLGTQPAIDVGAGTEWHLSGKLGINAEARSRLWRFRTPPGFFDPTILAHIADVGAQAPVSSDWILNLELSFGVSYYF